MKENKFPENLKKIRKNFKLSQEDLGIKINVSKQTISKYEKGSVEPNFHTLIEISRVFNCSIDELIFGNLKLKTKNPITLNLEIEKKLNSLKTEITSTINNFFEYEDDFNNEHSNVEFSQELSISSETIDKIINLDKYKLKNSINIDFYKNNNLKICDSSNSNFAYSNQEQLECISLYGNISCGALKYTDESIEGTFYLKKEDLKYDKNDYFILQVDGESMNNLYKNGDYILIHKTKNYEGYKPYIFILGDETTLKYIDIDLENQNITLVPNSTDTSYQNKILKFEDLSSINFGILGTVEGVLNFLD